MKKYLLFSVAALCLASCSNDNDNNENANKNILTPITVGAETDIAGNTTRSTWGATETAASGEMSIGVKFEDGEKFDMYELAEDGTQFDGKQTFTCIDGSNFQSANFTGTWHADGTHWAAVIPSGASNSVTLHENYNDYNVTIPASQQTSSTTTTYVINEQSITAKLTCPDNAANVMVAARPDHTSATCFFSPVVAYLKFTTSSDISSVIVKSANTIIAGNMFIRTNPDSQYAFAWNGWREYVDAVQVITPVSGQSAVHEITATGVSVSGANEYVVCVLPGTYAAGDLVITKTDGTVLKANTKAQTLSAVYLYNLGNIDGHSN